MKHSFLLIILTLTRDLDLEDHRSRSWVPIIQVKVTDPSRPFKNQTPIAYCYGR